jgi:hypothetical protein
MIDMIIVGCDYHPAFNKLLLWLPTLGNCNSGGWSILRWQKFCRNLATNGMKVGVGMEARGEPRFPTTAVASPPHGASAHVHHESAKSGGMERRLTRQKELWREQGREQLKSFRLAPWASRRRQDLLVLLDRVDPTIAELSQAIEQEVEKYPEARRLMTHPGVGPLTTLSFVLIIGRAETISVRKADRELSGTGAVGRPERESATTGAYHQTGGFRYCAS